MEKGFYHPSIGYWQTTNQPSAEILASYPSGYIEVPLKPGEGYEWENSSWVYYAPVKTSEQIDALRFHAYKKEADPLFFKAQRGEATMQEWLDKIQEIKERYPDPA
jgi:hypothetical protein